MPGVCTTGRAGSSTACRTAQPWTARSAWSSGRAAACARTAAARCAPRRARSPSRCPGRRDAPVDRRCAGYRWCSPTSARRRSTARRSRATGAMLAPSCRRRAGRRAPGPARLPADADAPQLLLERRRRAVDHAGLPRPQPRRARAGAARAAVVGVEAVLCVTGDGRAYDVRPDVTQVFDLDGPRLALLAARVGLQRRRARDADRAAGGRRARSGWSPSSVRGRGGGAQPRRPSGAGRGVRRRGAGGRA